MKRRNFLQNAALVAGSLGARELGGFSLPLSKPPTPVLDAHIHLFDPTRPGGVPWPKPDDAALYKPALPARYAEVSRGFGIVGAIAIEASPLLADNDWLLGIVEENPLIVGFIGDLVPGSPEFDSALARLHHSPLFLGIRYGNLWERAAAQDDLTADMAKPGFLDGLRSLAGAGLVFESANPTPQLIQTLADLAQQLPSLTIVVDHLPHGVPPPDNAGKATYRQNLARLGRSAKVFVKLSEVLNEKDGKVVTDPAAYQAGLDGLWDIFGEDKVMYGSDWPNSDHLAPYPATIRLLQRYIAKRGPQAQEKFFWRNSWRAYRWRPRTPAQSALLAA